MVNWDTGKCGCRWSVTLNAVTVDIHSNIDMLPVGAVPRGLSGGPLSDSGAGIDDVDAGGGGGRAGALRARGAAGAGGRRRAAVAVLVLAVAHPSPRQGGH